MGFDQGWIARSQILKCSMVTVLRVENSGVINLFDSKLNQSESYLSLFYLK